MMKIYSIGGLVFGCLSLVAGGYAQTDWPSFGNDPGAMRYSPLKQINAENVTQLKLAWKFDTTVANAAAPAPAIVNHGAALKSRRCNRLRRRYPGHRPAPRGVQRVPVSACPNPFLSWWTTCSTCPRRSGRSSL